MIRKQTSVPDAQQTHHTSNRKPDDQTDRKIGYQTQMKKADIQNEQGQIKTKPRDR